MHKYCCMFQNKKISGILVKRNFNYHIMSPTDLPTYTDLATSTVTQRQSVPYSGTINQLQYYLNQLSGDAERASATVGPTVAAAASSTSSVPTIRAFGGAIT